MTTTLLAVDDSVTMRKVLEITFSGDGYKTVLAASGQEAMKLLSTEHPAIVLIDHTLPDMSGYDLARDLKAKQRDLAVLILSSKGNPYDKARGSASGVDDFMDKPFDTQKMLDKVAAVLSGPRAAAGAPPPAPAARPATPAAPPVAPAPAAAAPPPKPVHAPMSPAVPAPAVAPSGPQQTSSMAARARSQGLTAPGMPAAAASPPRTPAAPVAAPARPQPPVAHPVVSAPPKPAAAPSIAAAVASAGAAIPGNGQLTEKLQALGLNRAQIEGVLSLSREVVEQVVWEVVPVLAETLIKEEIRRLTSS